MIGQLSLPDLQEAALATPISGYPGETDALTHRTRIRVRNQRVLLTLCLSTERCDCVGPMWHVSASLQVPGHRMLPWDGPVGRITVAALSGVGSQSGDELWWWHGGEVCVGHLRVPITADELARMDPCEPFPDDHVEPGIWRPRRQLVGT